MIAIFKSGGKQYSVQPGQVLKIEKIKGKKGDNCTFNDILAISDNSNHSIGEPLVKNASVKAKILDQIRDKKILVFKKRRRKNSRSTQGHRQYLTVLRIESISLDNKKTSDKTISKKIDTKEVKNKDIKRKDKVEKKPITKEAKNKKSLKKKTTLKETSAKIKKSKK